MEKKTKRQSGDVRRNQIKSAVKEIIFYDGLQNLTTKNIARKVGISEGTVFKHYVSKKAIIDDILKDVQTELVEPLQKIAMENIGASQRLEKHICYHLDYLARNEGITILLFTEASYQNDAGLKKMLDETYHTLEDSFARIVRDGIADGIWDNEVSVDDLSKLYMGIPLAMNIELLLQGSKVNNLDYCNKMQVLLRRILKK